MSLRRLDDRVVQLLAFLWRQAWSFILLLMIARLLLLLLAFGLGACAPHDFAASGRDAREYNPVTGRYEWPDERTGP